jgi:drug/metabolite transporter (DMT)-like permease
MSSKIAPISLTKAYVYMHVAVFLWGFTGILGKLIELPESLLIVYRLLITVPTLALVAWKKGTFFIPSAKQMRSLALVGCILIIHWIGFYGAIKYSNVTVALSCFSSTSIFTALLEPIMLGRRFRWDEMLFGSVVAAGIVLIFNFHADFGVGIVLAILAAVTAALMSILNKKLVPDLPAEGIMFYEMLSGGVFLLAILPFYLEWFPANKFYPSTQDWAYLVFFSLVCTVLAGILSLRSLSRLSPFTLNLSLNLEPVYGILFAFWLFEEHKQLNPGFWIGGGLIFMTVVVHGILKYREYSKRK